MWPNLQSAPFFSRDSIRSEQETDISTHSQSLETFFLVERLVNFFFVLYRSLKLFNATMGFKMEECVRNVKKSLDTPPRNLIIIILLLSLIWSYIDDAVVSLFE